MVYESLIIVYMVYKSLITVYLVYESLIAVYVGVRKPNHCLHGV